MNKTKYIFGFIAGILIMSSFLYLVMPEGQSQYKQKDVAACVISQILIEQNSENKVSWDSSSCDKVIYNDNQTYLIHNHYYVQETKVKYFMELYDRNGEQGNTLNWVILNFDIE